MRTAERGAALVLAAVAALGLGGCARQLNVPPTTSAISVVATDDECRLSVGTAKTGMVQFIVANAGTVANEFYVTSADGANLLAEVEGISPGASGTLQYSLPPGTYGFMCQPGMTTARQIRGTFTVVN